MQRDETRALNQLVDRALLQPTDYHRWKILESAQHRDLQRLIERIRRRATRLGRRERGKAADILAARDELVMAIYASLAPEGWTNAWCDGSSVKLGSTRSAGIGVILTNATGKRIARISRFVGDRSAFEAEVAALVAALETASAHNIERVRVNTDSKALAQLWQTRRRDPRLASLHRVASRFKGIQIRAIPRRHNQAAHALAQRAASVRRR